jgi:hypothetical protein
MNFNNECVNCVNIPSVPSLDITSGYNGQQRINAYLDVLRNPTILFFYVIIRISQIIGPGPVITGGDELFHNGCSMTGQSWINNSHFRPLFVFWIGADFNEAGQPEYTMGCVFIHKPSDVPDSHLTNPTRNEAGQPEYTMGCVFIHKPSDVPDSHLTNPTRNEAGQPWINN